MCCSKPEADRSLANESPATYPEDGTSGWVVRGGLVTAQQLANGARPIVNEPGSCEISAAYQPGRTVTELAALSRFPNAHISVATRDDVLAAGAIAVRETPGRNPVHADIIVPCAGEGSVDRRVLEALAAVFVQQANPARGVRR